MSEPAASFVQLSVHRLKPELAADVALICPSLQLTAEQDAKAEQADCPVLALVTVQFAPPGMHLLPQEGTEVLPQEV